MRPIGFNHDIALALAPGDGRARSRGQRDRHRLFARLDRRGRRGDQPLDDKLRARWPLPTALAFLAWFVFAPQCISTIAVTRRETNGWKWPLFMVGYLFVARLYRRGPDLLDGGRARSIAVLQKRRVTWRA